MRAKAEFDALEWKEKRELWQAQTEYDDERKKRQKKHRSWVLSHMSGDRVAEELDLVISNYC